MEPSKSELQLLTLKLSSIPDLQTYGFHQRNVGQLLASSTKLMIQANHQPTNLTELKLILPTDQEPLKELPQMMLLLLTD